MDELMIVGEFDWHRSIYEYVMDMVVFTIPSNMKTSHVADELRRLVQPPHLCLYDGLLGVQIDANELCQRIASCSSDDRKRHAQLFVPLRLEHWLVRHLVTVHLLLSEMRVVYYDPNGVSYDNETRVIVGMEHDGESVTPRRFIEMLLQSLPGWNKHSAGLQQQGLLSPLSCGRFNLQYIRESVSTSK
jgi:hypothetical protein